MDRLVDVLFRQGRLILVCWVLLTIAAGAFAAGLEGRVVPGGEASATSQAESVARQLSDNDVPSLFVVVTGEAALPNAHGRRELAELQSELINTAGVRDVMPLPLPPPASGTGPVTVLGITATRGIDGAIKVAEELLKRDALSRKGSQVFLGGYGAHREELVRLSRSDLLRAEKVGLPIVLVVLLLTFGSLWATMVPLAIGLAALLGGLGAAGALAYIVPFSEYVTNAASMVGLALAVDYAMFLVHRVRESLRRGTAVDEAIRAVMRTTGVAIAWSGITVMAAEATMLLVDSRSMQTAGLGMILVTFSAVLAALVGAPIILRLLGHRILRRSERERLEWAKSRGTSRAPRTLEQDGGSAGHGWFRLGVAGRQAVLARRRDAEVSDFWWRWGVRVTRRPAAWLTGGALVLAALFVPALDLGQRVDLPSASSMPADSQVRQASELVARAYGAGVLSPVEIIVHATPKTVRAQADGMAELLRSQPEVRGVQTFALRQPDLYRVSVATTPGPADDRTEAFVRNLRDGNLQESFGNVRYEVGGESAMRVDATDALFAGLPLMMSVLLALVLMLFIVAMRSIVLPIKAVLLVLISLGASTGVLLLLSTTQWGANLIGWSQPQDLHPIVPITIVAIVIALATDYEVILISRIAERYRETGDNSGAIVDGVARTGRVISSAAAIMIAVFFGFALSDVTPLRQLGVGLAFAVLIDATLIRGVLVPASMQLMGRWNWWFPGQQGKLLASASYAPVTRKHNRGPGVGGPVQEKAPAEVVDRIWSRA